VEQGTDEAVEQGADEAVEQGTDEAGQGTDKTVEQGTDDGERCGALWCREGRADRCRVIGDPALVVPWPLSVEAPKTTSGSYL
jgi:hypothetical protein